MKTHRQLIPKSNTNTNTNTNTSTNTITNTRYRIIIIINKNRRTIHIVQQLKRSVALLLIQIQEKALEDFDRGGEKQ